MDNQHKHNYLKRIQTVTYYKSKPIINYECMCRGSCQAVSKEMMKLWDLYEYITTHDKNKKRDEYEKYLNNCLIYYEEKGTIPMAIGFGITAELNIKTGDYTFICNGKEEHGSIRDKSIHNIPKEID